MYIQKKEVDLFYELFIFNLLFIIIKSSITIEAIFNSIGEHILYCEEPNQNQNFFGTSNLNVYKILENGNLINVNSQLKMKQDNRANPYNYLCPKNIFYSTSSNNERILIQFNNIQNIFGLFRNSTAVNIKIKSGNFDNYEDCSLMFCFCGNLISLDLSKFSFKKIKYIYSFLYNCSNLEEIIWPNNKENSLIEDVQYMFALCSKLTSIDLSFFDFSKVKFMNGYFDYCYNLEKIIFPKNILYIQDINAMFLGCKKLSSIDLSNFNFNKIYNMSYLFYNCEKLNTIIWPKTTFSSSYDYCSYSHMFSNCQSLISIDLSNFYIHGINDLSYMFFNCINLENIKLKGYLDWEKGQAIVYNPLYLSNIIAITSTNNMFQNCNSLKELNLLSINIKYTHELFNNNNLEGCLYNEYNQNMKKCSNYMGFYYCGNCINDNIDEYCTKEMQGIHYNFYYFGQPYLSYDKKQCFWSNKNYYFDRSISQFIKCNVKCKECEFGVDLCSLCNDGYYKIEEQEYNCSKLPPADNYALDIITNEWRKCDKRCKKCLDKLDQ